MTYFRLRHLTRASLGGAAVLALASASPVAAEPWTVAADYTFDIAGPVQGGASRSGRFLDNLNVTVDGDLETIGWRGAKAHLAFLNNSGGQPNEIAGTLQGVNNIEVSRPRGKAYEAWVEQTVGPVSALVGLYDLNSDFYATDAAGLFIAPAFGIGSELAATGPNGPSIFPSTALAVRLNYQPSETAYLRAAAIDAHAGVIGDPGGVDVSFEDGALLVGEAGWTGRGKVAVGAWRYTERQPAFVESDPAAYKANGAYLLVEQPIGAAGDGVRATTAFLRLGGSDGETTPFRGGGQVGLSVSHLFSARPESAFAIGYNQGRLSSDYRAAIRADSVPATKTESGVEITYADQVTSRISLQPSVQYVHDPAGDGEARDVVVLTLRANLRLR
jgi:porin